MWTAASGITENRPYLAGGNFLMFCRTDCKSVFKVLSLSTKIQFSTDLALMNIQPQRIKVDDATRTNDSRDISWYPDSCKGKLLKLVSLTNLFETLYPRLIERCPGKQILKPICASVPPVLLFLLLFPTLEFYRLEKVFYASEAVLLLLHESRIKLISDQFD